MHLNYDKISWMSWSSSQAWAPLISVWLWMQGSQPSAATLEPMPKNSRPSPQHVASGVSKQLPMKSRFGTPRTRRPATMKSPSVPSTSSVGTPWFRAAQFRSWFATVGLPLSGNVDWFYQKKVAEEDVRQLSGVHGVLNNIEIKPHAKADDIKRKIEDALKRHAEVEAKAIRITVRDNDRVLLEGKVDNWDERYAIENAAWSAAGVRSVEDRITRGLTPLW